MILLKEMPYPKSSANNLVDRKSRVSQYPKTHLSISTELEDGEEIRKHSFLTYSSNECQMQSYKPWQSYKAKTLDFSLNTTQPKVSCTAEWKVANLYRLSFKMYTQ